MGSAIFELAKESNGNQTLRKQSELGEGGMWKEPTELEIKSRCSLAQLILIIYSQVMGG